MDANDENRQQLTADELCASEIGENMQLSLSLCRAGYSCLLALLLGVYLSGYRTFLGSGLSSELGIGVMKASVNCLAAFLILSCSLTSTGDLREALNALRSTEITWTKSPSEVNTNFKFLLLILSLVLIDCLVFGTVLTLKEAWGYYLATVINNASADQFTGHMKLLKNAFYEIQQWLADASDKKKEAAICSFERLTTAAEHYNEAFGTRLLLIVGANFILATINAFLVVAREELSTRLISIIWGLYSASQPLRIVYTIDHLIKQRNEFNNRLNTLLVRGDVLVNPTVSAKIKLHVAMKKELEFTAKGFFSLDYSLINSMLGAVTTYLVILLQFNL